jgi:hypothetical protein
MKWRAGVGNDGNDAHLGPAQATAQRDNLEDACEEQRPDIARRQRSGCCAGGAAGGRLGRCANVVTCGRSGALGASTP